MNIMSADTVFVNDVTLKFIFGFSDFSQTSLRVDAYHKRKNLFKGYQN